MTHEMLCPVCSEGKLHSDKTFNNIHVANGIKSVIRHFHWCDGCGAEIALDQDLRLNGREALQVKRRALGRMTGAQIKSLREDVLKISQLEAGKIFGGGPVAFSKYENNDMPPSDAMDNLLWLVCRDSRLAYELAERARVPLKRPSLRTDVSSRTSISPLPSDKSQVLAQDIRASQMNSGISASTRAILVDEIRQEPVNYNVNFSWPVVLEAA
jgi:HTH-type transcriptional regulator / antitoxin MqsA